MRKTLKFFGWILIVLGILGFFSNPVVGSDANTWIHADFNHNLLHLVTGFIMLWSASKDINNTRGTLKAIGWIYLILAILGFFLVSGTGTLLGLIEVDGAGNWLHLVLAIILLLVAKKV